MMDKNLFEKLQREEALDLAESLQLDEMLEAQAPLLKEVLTQLPLVSPSLAWRSSLNQKLLATQVAQKVQKRRFRWVWVSGLSVAGAAASFILLSSHAVPHQDANRYLASSSKVEMALADSHSNDSSKISMGFDLDEKDSSVSGL